MCDKNNVRKFMFKELRDYSNSELWDELGDVNCTRLAEEAALVFDHLEWLDDETHWVWDLAVDIAADAEMFRTKYEKKKKNRF